MFTTNTKIDTFEDAEEYSGDRPSWHIPSLRTWEINENSTRYDNVLAAPSDDDLVKMWFGWASITGLVSLFTIMVLIPIIATKKTRNNPFNRYLIYLMIPDIIFSFCCGVTCLVNAISEKYVAEWSCKAQSFYFIFDVAANAWLNAAVCYQLYQMLSCAKRFQRYSPPTLKKVTIDAGLVYIWAAFVASWGLLDQSWWPHKTYLVIGAACIPVDFSTGSTIFFYTVFFPALIGIPFVYVIYAAYQIQKHNMIPPTGKRRVLSMYFFRLAAAFIIMWLPALLFMYILNPWVGYWVIWFGGSWSHLQGGVSAALSLWKPDIAKTVYQFWTCKHGLSGGGSGEQSEDLELFSSFPETRPSFLQGIARRLSSTTFLSSTRHLEEQGERRKPIHISGLSLGSVEENSGGSSGGQRTKSRGKSSSSLQKLESGSSINMIPTQTQELSMNSDENRIESSNLPPNHDNNMTTAEEEEEEEEKELESNGSTDRIDMAGNNRSMSPSKSAAEEVVYSRPSSSPPPPITLSEPERESPV